MPEIVIKADSPAATLEMLLSLARPHFAAPASAPVSFVVTDPSKPAYGAGTYDPNADFVRTATEMQDAMTKPVIAAIEKLVEEKTTEEPPKRRGRKPKAAEAPVTEPQPKISLMWPDGTLRGYDEVGDAMEAMADGLDLCETEEDVKKFTANNEAVWTAAGDDAARTFLDVARERISEIAAPLDAAVTEAEIKDAPPAKDPLPKGDTIGAKKVDAKPIDLQHMRTLAVKYAMASSKEDLMRVLGVARDGPTFKYVKGEPVPSLSTIPEDRRAWFVAKMREKVSVEEVPEE